MKKVFLSIIALAFVVESYSQTDIPKAQSMFIYNFCRFVEWPQSATSGSFIIGVLGGTDITTALSEYTAGKMVGMQSIVVKQYKDVASLDNCQILFIAYSKCGSLPEIVSKIGSYPTLSVADRKNSLVQGAAINFLLDDDRLKFELSVANATKNGIKINSKLQEMAASVK